MKKKKQKPTKEPDIQGGKLSALKVFEKENFFEMVWQVVRLIPKGRVTSYGAIAKYLGTGLSARMVGWAMNAANKAKPKVPAHRVLNRNGLLTGKHHFKTPTLMQELLEKENIIVVENQVKDFKKLFWDPAQELKNMIN